MYHGLHLEKVLYIRTYNCKLVSNDMIVQSMGLLSGAIYNCMIVWPTLFLGVATHGAACARHLARCICVDISAVPSTN